MEFSGAPFQYNPAASNINIDNQLAGILSQFGEDYVMDVIDDSLENRFRLYDLPAPNIVASYETTFKALTDGFSSNVEDIANTRKSTYINIVNRVCDYYNLQFNDNDDTDYYSAAYWIYDFLLSNFTQHMINFYVFFLLKERNSIVMSLDLEQMRRENDVVYSYSKRLFIDPKLAAIHSNLEYVIDQISTYDIDLWTILSTVYQNPPELAIYVNSLITDTGNFFRDQYEQYVTNSRNTADIIMYIKLGLQQLGGQLAPEIVEPASQQQMENNNQ